jgi:tetratricopeptide (TPR) repeat protein
MGGREMGEGPGVRCFAWTGRTAGGKVIRGSPDMTPGCHPERRDLEKLVLGQLDAEENLRILLHLLPGCAHCREITAALWTGAAGGASGEHAAGAGYGTAVERVYDRVRRAHAQLAAERAAAPLLLAALEGEPLERRESALRADPRYRTWAFCELLLGQGRARLAAAAAEGLDPAAYPPPVAADLAARCWGEAADVCRRAADFPGAEDALGRAAAHLIRGTGDRLALARLLDRKAALRSAQGRCDEAVRLLRRAAALYRRAGQLDSLGRVLIQESHLHACSGDPMAAVSALREGLALADCATGREPRLAFAACHSLAFLLDSLGRSAEARTLLAVARPLVSASGDPLDAVRLRHLEARIAAALGESAAAEEALGEVGRIFLARGMGYDAAVAALDLAEIFARQGRTADLAALGASLPPLFRTRDLHRETVAALLLFQKAACARSATPALVREVSGRVLRLRREG